MIARPFLAAIATSGGLFLLTSEAAARPNYPPQITMHLTLSYTPPCSVCHIDGVTGAQTVVTPFGYSMVSHGLSGKDGIPNALDAMTASGVDSDGDGVSDVAELVAGTDPNSPANGSLSGPTPRSGCGVARGGPDTDAALFAALAVTGALLAGRSRRRAAHGEAPRRPW